MTVQLPVGEFRSRRELSSTRPTVSLALVNNMPDGALRATERQFRHLVTRSVRAEDVQIAVYYFPDVRRGDWGTQHCRTHYRPVEQLFETGADAVIVTGCEPRAPSLRDEPFWRDFVRLVGWAKHETCSTLWSCLAAHGAVLHLDGIERCRLPRKLSGVFSVDKAGDHALLAGLPDAIRVPHSRFNTLEEGELLAADYRLLTRSDSIGVDMFVKAMPSLFVFLQGHPEYERDSLAREFRRDLDRYLTGQAFDPPTVPAHYFEPVASASVAKLLAAGAADHPANRGAFAALSAPETADWRDSATRFYRNWLTHVADLRRAAIAHDTAATPS